MHQKIRSLNVFFIVLDTKVTKRVPANLWAGYGILVFLNSKFTEIHLSISTKKQKGWWGIFCTAQQQGGVYCTVTGALQVAGATSLTYCIQGR
jgi:hypothetical protein